MSSKLIKSISSIIIFFISFLYINIFCQNNNIEISNIYSQISKLPVWSTIYFSRNLKCSSYSSQAGICLYKNGLYKITGESNVQLLSSISDYSDSYYYELSLYEGDSDHVNCIISHFFNKSKLIFKYYPINTLDNSCNGTDFPYVNDSMNPINKGISCYIKELDFLFLCYFINEEKKLIEFKVNKTHQEDRLDYSYKPSEISSYVNYINNYTLVMPSVLKNRLKFFSCLYCQGDSFDIIIKRPSGYQSKIKTYEFSCDNGEKIFLFSVFKTSCSGYGDDCQNKLENLNFNNTKLYWLKKPYDIRSNAELSDSEHNTALYLDNMETLLFFIPTNEIINFQFDDNINAIIRTTILSTNLPSTLIPKNEIIESTINYISKETYNTVEKITTNNYIIPKPERQIKELIIPKTIITKNEIIQNIKEIMDNTIIGETYEFKQDDFTVLIYPTDSNLLSNKTHIDFVECEYTLKSYYNLSNQSILTFFQMEITNNNQRSLINQVEYKVYDEQKNELELSICNNSNIKIFYGIKNNSNLDLDVLNSFKDSGVNVFNISDEFFNDVCYPYTEDGNDLILEDRIKDVYQNFTLCEEGCTFDSIDIYSMLISCKCDVKENMTTIIKEIEEEAAEQITSLNFEIIKCYNLVFSFKGKMENIGFWILSIMFLLYIIFLIKYCYEGIKPVKDYIFYEMNKFGYIDKEGNKNLNSINKKRNINHSRKQQSKNTKINNPPKKKTPRLITQFQNNNNIINNKKIVKNNNLITNRPNTKNKGLNSKDKSLINNKIINNLDLNLITINLNDLSKRDCTPKESNITLYNYTMEEAFKYDRRNILVIFYIYLLSKQAFFHAFLYRSPLALFSLRFCLLLFIISSDLALNAFFYFNDNISRKYKNTKNIFIFTLSNNMTVILLSTLVGFILLTLFTNLSNATKAVRDVFKNEEKKIRKNKNYKVTSQRKKEIKKNIENILEKYKCKLLIIFIIEIILMAFYWYYVVVFCHVFS